MGQLLFKSFKVIELAYPSCHCRTDWRSNEPRPVSWLSVLPNNYECFIDTAVITVWKDQNFRFFRNKSCNSKSPSVGIGCAESKWPQRKSKSFLEFGSDKLGISCWHHCCQATFLMDSLLDGFDCWFRGMSRHSTSVSEGEVNVLMSINVEKFVSMGFFEIEREPTSPFVHPSHGNLSEEVFSWLVGGLWFGVGLFVGISLGVNERLKFC